MNIVEVEKGVHFVQGGEVNWVILSDGHAATLVDTGYPGDRSDLLASLDAVGHRPEDVVALLVTHAHSDHIGSARYLAETYDVPVLAHEAEAPHARREFVQQVSAGRVLLNAWRPGVLPWAMRAFHAGGLSDVRVAAARPYPEPLDLPGGAVPHHTPGHTSGHCVYHLPGSGIVITGDALVTGHRTSRVRGPQLLPTMFHHDRPRALEALMVIADIDADVVLPGHGPAHHGSAREAVAAARAR